MQIISPIIGAKKSFYCITTTSNFKILRRLKYDGVFELIHKHNLLDSIHDQIVMLMDFNKEVLQ